MFKERMLQKCRQVKFTGTMTKWSVQNHTYRTAQKHAEHHDATDIQKKTVLNQNNIHIHTHIHVRTHLVEFKSITSKREFIFLVIYHLFQLKDKNIIFVELFNSLVALLKRVNGHFFLFFSRKC